MNRRDSVFALLAATIAGSSASAHSQTQVARKPFVIALLPDFFAPWEPWLEIITEGLREFGRIEGRDYVFYRSGFTYGQDTQLALIASSRPTRTSYWSSTWASPWPRRKPE